MGEIVRFPNGNGGAWRAYDEGVRAALYRLGYRADAADWVVADLKKRPFGLQFCEDLSAPAVSEEQGARQIKEAFKQVMLRWLVEIIKLEGELWVAKFGEPTGSMPRRDPR